MVARGAQRRLSRAEPCAFVGRRQIRRAPQASARRARREGLKRGCLARCASRALPIVYPSGAPARPGSISTVSTWGVAGAAKLHVLRK